MNAETLAQLLNRYAPVDAGAARIIFDSGEVEMYRRNEMVFGEKRFNAFEYFQFSGVSHRFNTNDEAHTITTGIFQNEAVITPHFARTTNGQSIFSVQALTDCTFLKVPAGAFSDMRMQYPSIRNFGQAVVEREFARAMHFEVLFRSANAKLRLVSFRKNYPGLENIIPHNIIASFLGITPVSFSRLRAELARD